MFTTLSTKGSRRTALVAAASVGGAFAVLGLPGLASAADQPDVIDNPTTTTTIPDDFSNPTFPTTTIPDDFSNPTFPTTTIPDDLTNPTVPEPTNPDPDQGGNPADPADQGGNPAPQDAPAGQLPETGVDAGAAAVLAVVLTAGGAAIVTLARRKPQAS